MQRLLVALLLVLGVGWAAPQISPQGIIVNPVPTDLEVRVWVDKDPGRTGNAVYQVGDPIRIFVTVNQDAYVYLFNVNADGRVDLILPNAFDRDNFLRAREVRRFPPPGARYEFQVSGPEGEDRVLAVASKRPLSLRDLAEIEQGRIKVRGLENLSRALSIIVRPVPDRDWITDSVRYFVGRAVAAPGPGRLLVETVPSGARVFIEGEFRGRAPLALDLRPGRYEVEVELEGFEDYEAEVRIQPGRTERLSVRLVPERRQGELVVDSTPAGAEVFVDGAFVGRTPLSLRLDEGRHEVLLRLEGHREFATTVRVRRGETSHVQARLVPLKATLEVRTNVEARVFLDGFELGRTRDGRLVAEVDPGVRELVVLAPGYRVFVTQVALEAGAVQRVFATLSRR